jgi:hypothetical protein
MWRMAIQNFTGIKNKLDEKCHHADLEWQIGLYIFVTMTLWGWHLSVETYSCVIHGVSRSAYVGWYIDCQNMHGMSNTQQNVYIQNWQHTHPVLYYFTSNFAAQSPLTLPWPAGHICPTYKESFQVGWDNSIPLFLHAAIYLEVSLFRWTSQNVFYRETAVYK